MATVPSRAVMAVNITCPKENSTRSPAMGSPTRTHWAITSRSRRMPFSVSPRTGERQAAAVISTPPSAREMAEAMAAPATPQPAPQTVKLLPRKVTLRVGLINRKFRKMLTPFISVLMSMGVLVLPVARRAEPRMMLAARNSIGVQMTAK